MLDVYNMKQTNYMLSDYPILLNKPEWKFKRKQIIQRDNNQCRNCGDNKYLQVHHRQYHFIKNTNFIKRPWDYNSEILITLCNNCHKSGHKNYKIPTYTI